MSEPELQRPGDLAGPEVRSLIAPHFLVSLPETEVNAPSGVCLSALKEHLLWQLTDQSSVFRGRWWVARQGCCISKSESLLVMSLQIQRERRVGGTGPLSCVLALPLTAV